MLYLEYQVERRGLAEQVITLAVGREHDQSQPASSHEAARRPYHTPQTAPHGNLKCPLKSDICKRRGASAVPPHRGKPAISPLGFSTLAASTTSPNIPSPQLCCFSCHRTTEATLLNQLPLRHSIQQPILIYLHLLQQPTKG